MATGSGEAADGGQAVARLELEDGVVRATRVVASFIERPLAMIDEMQGTAAAPAEANTELLLQLRSRLKRRGDRA